MKDLIKGPLFHHWSWLSEPSFPVGAMDAFIITIKMVN